MSRLPMKMELRRQQGEQAQIQGVRFVRPKIKWRSVAPCESRSGNGADEICCRTVALYALAYYLCYEAYNKIVWGPLDRAADEALQDLPEEEEEELEKPLFIPFPGTTKQLKPVPYKGSDPEWKEFIKFSKDQNLAKKVRGLFLCHVPESRGADNSQMSLRVLCSSRPANILF
jgi:hypothetical protein